MKKILLLSVFSLVSCGDASRVTSFKKIEKDITQYDYKMMLSSNDAEYSHIGTMIPTIVDGHPLQATGLAKNGRVIYISSNTQGEIVRGGLDIVGINSLGSPNIISSVVSANSEYAEIKYKDNHVFLVGQKKNGTKNDGVLTIVNVSDSSNPSVVSEMVFEEGYYATSIDIEGTTAYITVPNVGLKVVNISNPSSPQLVLTEVLSIVSTTGTNFQPSAANVAINHYLSSDWTTGYGYQLNIINNTGVLIDDWTICFDYNHPVAATEIWGATVDSSSAKPNWKLNPVSYSKKIYPSSTLNIGWNSFPGGVNGELLSNVRFISEGNASCDQSPASTPFENSLFVRRYNGTSLVLGGGDSHKLVSSSITTSVVKEISTQVQEAPSRFVIKGNSLFSNAGNSGLTIIDNLNTSAPSIAIQESLAGTGNGITIDGCDRLYLAQGEVGLSVINVSSHSNPVSLGFFDYADDHGSANNVFNTKIDNLNYIFVADGLGGVKIIKVQSPTICPEEVIPSPGLSCKVYDFAPNTPTVLPNMSVLTPVGLFTPLVLDVVDQTSHNSFPLFPDSLKYLKTYYGISCSGKFKPAKFGKSKIKLSSDDGSKLYLDGNLIINGDGLHSTESKSANVTLVDKVYDIKIDYFQGPHVRINLELFIKYPTGSEVLMNGFTH